MITGNGSMGTIHGQMIIIMIVPTAQVAFRTQRSQGSYVMTQRATRRMKMQEELEHGTVINRLL
jgi:hypothetical protein